MTEYRCPECGGELVWDYERGEVTCSRCGLVVDRIYDYGPPREKEETREREKLLERRKPRINRQLRRYRLYLRRYEKARRYVEGKPWLEIDYDLVLSTGKMINSIKSKSTLRAEKNIEEHGLWETINKTITLIEQVYPVALARTRRSKYALAYIVYNLREKHRLPSQDEVTEIFQVSTTSYKRLVKIAKTIVKLSKPVITATQ